MPILPLDQNEPEMRVMALMHYPEPTEENAEKIEAYVKANTIRFGAPDERQNWDDRLKAWSVEQEEKVFKDFRKKAKRGTIAGALYATYFKLMIEAPERAS